MNQNQSWNLSLEGAWNSTTIDGNTENRTFNEVYEILTSTSNPLAYDRKGNLTQNRNASQYTWDYNNQLSHAVNASSESLSYTYDALGRRISKQVDGTTIVYVNVGYQIATEYQSTDGINFNEKQSYVYATYIDDPLVLVKASGERFYYHSNGQFSISKITDEYKNIVEAYAYNAYGDVQILQSYAGLDNPYYFTGRQLDQETGLFYFRARYYDAKLGQFISRDPIGYVDGMSLYRGYFVPLSFDYSGKNVGVLSVAGGFAAVDGPLPIGDVIAGVIVVLWVFGVFDQKQEAVQPPKRKAKENVKRLEYSDGKKRNRCRVRCLVSGCPPPTCPKFYEALATTCQLAWAIVHRMAGNDGCHQPKKGWTLKHCREYRK